MSCTADVDDVVQDTMFRVIRGIDSLREPERLRSWLVAVTINQIREHYRRRDIAPAPLDELSERPDPQAEFVEVALSRLHLAQQRREVDEAARWLDPADRELLALWTLERAGHLTRGEVTDALDLGAHAVTVRVSRLKNRLEAIRPLVRALAAEPRCGGLSEAVVGWPGEPNPLWRKRLLRHLDECARCRRGVADTIPVERILTGAALLVVPAGYFPWLLDNLSAPGALAVEPVAHATHLSDAGLFKQFVATKPVLAVAGAVAICALVGVTGAMVFVPSEPPPVTAQAPAFLSAPTSTTSAAATTSASPAPSSSAAPSSAPATTSQPAPPAPEPPRQATPEERVLALINKVRAEAGVPALKVDNALVTAADRHNGAMIADCGLSHQCPGEKGLGERATAAGAKWSTVGENVGMGGPVANRVDPISEMALGLTQSMIDEKPPNDGHRRNILSKSFTRVGIVVTRDAEGTVWMTHDFAGG